VIVTLGSYLKITELAHILGPLYSTFNFGKNIFRYTFFTSSSGHPGPQPKVGDPGCPVAMILGFKQEVYGR
jgi:hypothetical protein